VNKGEAARQLQDLMALPMPMERGRQATMKEIRGLRRASRLRDRSADVSMSADWWSMMTWHKALSKAVVLWLPPTMSQSANLSPSVSTAAWMSLSCFRRHVTVGCLGACVGCLGAARDRLAQAPCRSPHCTARLWHTYHKARLWLWPRYTPMYVQHIHADACGTPKHASANSYHMPRLCHTHSSRARAARQQDPRHCLAHVEPESMQGRAGAMREASGTAHGAAGYGTEEMEEGEIKDLTDGLALGLGELLAHGCLPLVLRQVRKPRDLLGRHHLLPPSAPHPLHLPFPYTSIPRPSFRHT